MKNIVCAGLAGMGLVCTLAVAQDSPQGHDPDAYHTDRTARFHEPHWHSHIFNDVRLDVQHVSNVTWPDGKDGYRLSKTEEELSDLQAKLESHTYDEHELDGVIRVLSKVVADNRMEYRDRDMLKEDLQSLQQYRKHHAAWESAAQ